jgi:hypothetical protein
MLSYVLFASLLIWQYSSRTVPVLSSLCPVLNQGSKDTVEIGEERDNSKLRSTSVTAESKANTLKPFKRMDIGEVF